MSIKRIFIVISAIFAASAVFADNSSVTSKKYVDDLMSGYQGKLPGSGANKLMIYDDETGIGEKSIETTLVSNATGVPTVGAVKTGLDGVQDTITGTAGYVMTGTGNPGDVGERAIYGTAVYSNSLVTAETVNTGVTDAVNSSLIRVDENGDPSDSGTLWEINTDLFAIGVLPSGYTQLEWIESTGTQYIDTGITGTGSIGFESEVSANTYGNELGLIATSNTTSGPHYVLQAHLSSLKLYLGGSLAFTFTSDKDMHHISFNTDGNKEAYTDGVQVTNSYTASIPQINQTFYLFARNVGGSLKSDSAGQFTCKYFKIYRDGILIAHFVPTKNSSDVVGMYDLVSGQFFTNQGTGEFIAGPPVEN